MHLYTLIILNDQKPGVPMIWTASNAAVWYCFCLKNTIPFILMAVNRFFFSCRHLQDIPFQPHQMANDESPKYGKKFSPFTINYPKTSLNISLCPLFSLERLNLNSLHVWRIGESEREPSTMTTTKIENLANVLSQAWIFHNRKTYFSSLFLDLSILYRKFFFSLFTSATAQITTTFEWVLVLLLPGFMVRVIFIIQWYWKFVLCIFWDLFYVIYSHNTCGNDFVAVGH